MRRTEDVLDAPPAVLADWVSRTPWGPLTALRLAAMRRLAAAQLRHAHKERTHGRAR